jgi:hypothetical protein
VLNSISWGIGMVEIAKDQAAVTQQTGTVMMLPGCQ